MEKSIKGSVEADLEQHLQHQKEIHNEQLALLRKQYDQEIEKITTMSNEQVESLKKTIKNLQEKVSI